MAWFDSTCISDHIMDTFLDHFWNSLAWNSIFFSHCFSGCIFWCVFSSFLGQPAPMPPKMDHEFQKKLEIVLSCSVPALQTPFRNNFGSISAVICSILEAIWDVLAIRWSSCSIDFSHVRTPILTLPKLLPHIKLSFSWLGRRAESQCMYVCM